MAHPTAAPRPGCPELEQLGAFVEGRLPRAEREALAAHLADCDACREIVAEAAALVSEIADRPAEGAEVAPFPDRRRTRRPWLKIAAAALLAVATAVVLSRNLRPGTDAVLAGLGERGGVAATLGEGWADPLWSVTRGAGPAVSEKARAFRLGARGADLELALRTGDGATARRLAAECAWLLADVPLADPVAAVYRDLAQRLGAPTRLGAPDLLDAAATGGRLAREAVEPEHYDLGRWSETGRLLAASGRGGRPPKPPALPAGLDPALRALVERAARPELDSRSEPSLAAFADLVARGGDLR